MSAEEKRKTCFLVHIKTVVALISTFVCAALVFSLAPPARTSTGVLSLHSTYLVDRLTDANPAGGGEGSGLAGDLRYALTNAQSGDRITFNVTGTINLAGALPSLTRNVSIEGPGANHLTVRGVGGSVFAVASGTTVVLSGLTITGGVGNGGGIFNGGTLTLNNAMVSGNVAGDPTNGGGTGAGIWNYVNATLTLNRCTVSGNSVIGNLSYSPSRGGGIANYGRLTLTNSTVSGNSATQGFGGGIKNIGTLTLTNSTVSDNSATGAGGGVDNRGTLNARNTILAGNMGSDLYGTLTSQGYNLIGNTTGGSGFDPTDLLNVDPLLTALGNYGGPTRVHMLKVGSPAIDAVVDNAAPTTDQRGVTRPQGGGYDIGAVERRPTEPELVADAGGPYTVDEGSSVTLDGSGSIGVVTYAWDLDNDSQFDDAAIPNPVFSAALLDDGAYAISLRVTNGALTQTQSSTVTVLNVAPTVWLTATATIVEVGTPITFTGSFIDPGVLDTHSIGWNFGDGSPSVNGALVRSYVYTQTGEYTVSLMVADDDGGVGQASRSLHVLSPGTLWRVFLPVLMR